MYIFVWMQWCMCGSQNPTNGSQFSLLPHWFQELNSENQAWGQAPSYLLSHLPGHKCIILNENTDINVSQRNNV